MAALTYRVASEAEKIGEKLVANYYPDIQDSGVRVTYLFRSEHAKHNGKARFGQCQKIGGVQGILSSLDGLTEVPTEPKDAAYYLITLAEDLWKGLTENQRIALVDHELAHVLIEEGDEDGTWNLRTRGHDLEEFADVVKRHGVWMPDLEYFLRTAGDALQLPFGEKPS